MVAEMVPYKELQPKAFSVMPLVWSLGSVVGPSFGGLFAQPAKQFPGLFGNIEFFKKFPFALPNLIATVFFLISAASAFFFLHVSVPPTAIDCPKLLAKQARKGNVANKEELPRLGFVVWSEDQ
jgi:MFS family permease